METNTKKLYTREKIYTAFVQLAKNKPVQEMKVSELCREAGINRSTFYLHYQDMDELIDEIKIQNIQRFIEEVKQKRRSPKDINLSISPTTLIDYQDFLETMKDAQKEKELVMVMLGEHGDSHFYAQLKDSLRDLLSYFFQDYFTTLEAQFPNVPKDYLDIILYNISVEIILHWIEKGMVESPEEIGTIISSARIVSPLALLESKEVTDTKKQREDKSV